MNRDMADRKRNLTFFTAAEQFKYTLLSDFLDMMAVLLSGPKADGEILTNRRRQNEQADI